MKIRFALDKDIPEITGIFNHYILNSNARFEEEIFSYENRAEWFKQFDPNSKHQIYVAVENQSVLGFACSQPYRPSIAFDSTVEVTIYLSENTKGRGVGSTLYRRLLSELSGQPVHRALSGIALPNEASIALHEKFGFKKVGVFDQYAKKHGDYISSIWLEKCFPKNH